MSIVGVFFAFLPGIILVWALIRSFRTQQFPVFWWLFTVNREARPRLYAVLMIIMLLATIGAFCIGLVLALAFSGAH